MQERYEKHHHCVYTPEALNAAVVLSARYISDRQLPDKAIDLLDEAGSRVRIAAHTARKAALQDGQVVADAAGPWTELQQVLEAKDEAIKVHSQAWSLPGIPQLLNYYRGPLCINEDQAVSSSACVKCTDMYAHAQKRRGERGAVPMMQEGLFEEAGLLREREVDMKVRLSGLPEEVPTLACVTVSDIEAVLASWTGMPVQRMTQDDRERLARMEPALKVPAGLLADLNVLCGCVRLYSPALHVVPSRLA
jgi:ATP-dependent Clp protease ATP-binding subunit ClpC